MTHMDASSESLLHHTYFFETHHCSHSVHQKISGIGHSKKGVRSMIAPQYRAHANLRRVQAEIPPHPAALITIHPARALERSGTIQHHHNAIRLRVERR